MIIKKYDTLIYPFKIWIAKDADGDKLNDMFELANSDRHPDFNFQIKRFKIITTFVCEKKTRNIGAIIYFEKGEKIEAWDVAHEAVHAACFCIEHLGDDITHGEPLAYLVEFIVKCYYKTK